MMVQLRLARAISSAFDKPPNQPANANTDKLPL